MTCRSTSDSCAHGDCAHDAGTHTTCVHLIATSPSLYPWAVCMNNIKTRAAGGYGPHIWQQSAGHRSLLFPSSFCSSRSPCAPESFVLDHSVFPPEPRAIKVGLASPRETHRNTAKAPTPACTCCVKRIYLGLRGCHAVRCCRCPRPRRTYHAAGGFLQAHFVMHRVTGVRPACTDEGHR